MAQEGRGVTLKEIDVLDAIQELCKPQIPKPTKQFVHPQLQQAIKEYVESQQKLKDGR